MALHPRRCWSRECGMHLPLAVLNIVHLLDFCHLLQGPGKASALPATADARAGDPFLPPLQAPGWAPARCLGEWGTHFHTTRVPSPLHPRPALNQPPQESRGPLSSVSPSPKTLPCSPSVLWRGQSPQRSGRPAAARPSGLSVGQEALGHSSPLPVPGGQLLTPICSPPACGTLHLSASPLLPPLPPGKVRC